VADFFAEGIHDLLGARVYSEPYPNLAAKLIQMHIRRKRLEWARSASTKV
jgi:carbon-monoxide dehydrogenase catalytic subunit